MSLFMALEVAVMITSSRDIIDFCNNGYVLKKIRPVDMFPNTPHIECVSTLEYDN